MVDAFSVIYSAMLRRIIEREIALLQVSGSTSTTSNPATSSFGAQVHTNLGRELEAKHEGGCDEDDELIKCVMDILQVNM